MALGQLKVLRRSARLGVGIVMSLALLSTLNAVAVSASPAASAPFPLLRSTGIRFPKGPTAEFHLKTPGGYRVQVYGTGPFVSLSVSTGFAFSSYTVRGFVGPHRIRAHFADLGDISVRFKASGRVSHRTLPVPSCRTATRFTYRYGTFSGEIRFPGESGYLGLDAHRAKGALVTQKAVKRQCPKGHHRHRRHRARRHRRPKPKTPALWATSGSSQTTSTKSFAIEAVSQSSGKDIAFVFVDEKSASVDITRMAFGLFAPSSFIFDNALSSAQVTLSTPFSGTGDFLRNSDGSISWTGSLTASFPGAESMSLTGPEWQAHLAWHRTESENLIIVAVHP
jgi:hypothetical protein